jgi:hypothetical protein
MNTPLMFSRGLSKDLPLERTDGKIYYCIDTNIAYIDVDDKRHWFGGNYEIINIECIDADPPLKRAYFSGQAYYDIEIKEGQRIHVQSFDYCPNIENIEFYLNINNIGYFPIGFRVNDPYNENIKINTLTFWPYDPIELVLIKTEQGDYYWIVTDYLQQQ